LALADFSCRSLGQPYGRTFLRDVVLRHPFRLLAALGPYVAALGSGPCNVRPLATDNGPRFIELAAGAAERLLVATGFCQKPFGCPAGRFNHDCLYLSRLTSAAATPFPAVCTGCAIRALGQSAFGASASFAVLTSAADIAGDILLPALEARRFTHAVLAVCPYSVEPMSLALLSCGIRGYIAPYGAGACANYAQWLRADGGDKPERTALSPEVLASMLKLLDQVGAARREQHSPKAMRYVQFENVYRPEVDCSADGQAGQVAAAPGMR
jgi:hypothetical protein